VAANVGADGDGPALEVDTVARLGVVALVLVLFEGGFSGGARRMLASVRPVIGLGVLGTLATSGLLALLGSAVVGLPWQTALLVGIALAPTDPAAVFSILGSRDVHGRSSAIVEGESGANDPVGIALMLGALAYMAGDGSLGAVALDFLLELVVGVVAGGVIGVVAARLLGRANFRAEGLFPLAAIAAAFLAYGVAVLLHGSGFLAVLIAGLLLGDALRHQRAIGQLVAFCAALSDIVMFTALGLSVQVDALGAELLPALALFGLLTFLVRPLVVAAILAPADLDQAERTFIAWGGLKGAVPVLLAAFAVLADVDEAGRIYAIVFIAVAASIIVQGGSIPWLIDRLGLVEEHDEDD